MAFGGGEPAYLIMPREYEASLRAHYQTGLATLDVRHSRHLEDLQAELVQARLMHTQELAKVRAAEAKATKDALRWRAQMYLYKTNAEESAQLWQDSLAASERRVLELMEDQETLLESVNSLQEQLQTITELCQHQHRAGVVRQGQLEVMGAEVKELRSQLVQAQELSDLLTMQLAAARAAQDGARCKIHDLQQQLAVQAQSREQASAHMTLQTEYDKLRASAAEGEMARAGLETQLGKLNSELAQLQAHASAHAAVQSECSKLRTSVAEGVVARAGLEAQLAKLRGEIQARSTELSAAEERLARASHDSAQRDEQRRQDLQALRAADGAIIKDLQVENERLKERLDKGRRDAEQEQELLAAKLEREVALREALAQECAGGSKQLWEVQRSHDAALGQLRRQVNDQAVDLKQAAVTAKLLDEQLVASEKRVTARDGRIDDLEAALECSTQQLGQQVSSKDAAFGALKEQIEQQRQKVERKEAELREALEAHARQVGRLEQRLAQQETAAQGLEMQLQQQAESAKRQVGYLEANMREQVTELQASLAARDGIIKQLTDGQAAVASQHDQRLGQLQAGHVAEVVRLETRVHELECQLTAASSPAEVERKEAELREALEVHARQVGRLERRLAQQETAARDLQGQLQQQAEGMRHLQHQADIATRQVGYIEAQMREQVAELQATLAARDARIKQLTDGQAAVSSQHDQRIRQLQADDAAEMAGLQLRARELEAQLAAAPSPSEVERKEAELREAQEVHARQVGRLEQQLAQQEAAARDLEGQLQQQAECVRHLQHQADIAKRQVGHTEGQMRERVTELQASLAARDERIKQLTDGRAADASQHYQRLGQLQASHLAEAARLEERIRELQHPLMADSGATEPQPNQVPSAAAAAVNKLVGSLRSSSLELGSRTDDEEEEEDHCHGPTADLILGMSQPHLPAGLKGAPVLQPPAAAASATATPAARGNAQRPVVATAPVAPQNAHEQPMPLAASGSDLDSEMVTAGRAARTMETGKRPLEPSAGDEEHPGGRGRGRKAAKRHQEPYAAEATIDLGKASAEGAATPAAVAGSSPDAPYEVPPSNGQVQSRRTRSAVQRVAAAAASPAAISAADNAQSTGLAASKDYETSVPPGSEAPSAEANWDGAGVFRDRNGALAPVRSGASAQEAPLVAAAKAAAHPGLHPLACAAAAADPKQPAPSRPAAAPMQPPSSPSCMGGGTRPPPPGKATAGLCDSAAAGKPSNQEAWTGGLSLRDLYLKVTKKAKQPQQQPLSKQQVFVAMDLASIFGQEGFTLDAKQARASLAAVEPRLLELARSRGVAVPFETIRQWKPQASSAYRRM